MGKHFFDKAFEEWFKRYTQEPTERDLAELAQELLEKELEQAERDVDPWR